MTHAEDMASWQQLFPAVKLAIFSEQRGLLVVLAAVLARDNCMVIMLDEQ